MPEKVTVYIDLDHQQNINLEITPRAAQEILDGASYIVEDGYTRLNVSAAAADEIVEQAGGFTGDLESLPRNEQYWTP